MIPYIFLLLSLFFGLVAIIYFSCYLLPDILDFLILQLKDPIAIFCVSFLLFFIFLVLYLFTVDFHKRFLGTYEYDKIDEVDGKKEVKFKRKNDVED